MKNYGDEAELMERGAALAAGLVTNPLARVRVLQELGAQPTGGGNFGQDPWEDFLIGLVRESTTSSVQQAAALVAALERVAALYQGPVRPVDYVRALNTAEPGLVLEEVEGSVRIDERRGVVAEALVKLTDGRIVPVIANQVWEELAGCRIYRCFWCKNIGGRLWALVQINDPRSTEVDEERWVPVIAGELLLSYQGRLIKNADWESFDEKSCSLRLLLALSQVPVPVVAEFKPSTKKNSSNIAFPGKSR